MAAAAAVPLEKREKLVDKTQKKRLCLDPQFAYQMKCISYEPVQAKMNAADIAEWQERLQFLVNDFRELLSAEYSQFWCQVIFEPSIIPSLNSYLKFAPRPNDIVSHEVPSECSDLHDELHRLVFLVLLRLSTYKESKTDFITPSVFGDIIYQNYIFDITKLLDICCLYGLANQKLVAKMIENIFNCQPSYKSDLQDWFSVMKKLFEKFRVDCKLSSTSGSPQKLDRATEHLSDEELVDRLLYAVDAVSSLDIFLQIASFLADDFLQNGFEQLIVHLFEDLVPHFKDEIKQCEFKEANDRQICRRALKRFVEISLSVYRRIVFPACLGPLVDSLKEGEGGQNLIELFINTTLHILGCKRFLGALEERFPFEEDLDLVRQSGFGSSIDDAQVSYIRTAAESARREVSSNRQGVILSEHKPPPVVGSGKGTKQKRKQKAAAASHSVYDDEPGCPTQLAVGQKDSSEEHPENIQLAISTVLDILPDLGPGFVKACLTEYHWSSERVVNAILEGSLPPHLDGLDRNLPLQPTRVSPSKQVTARHSIFDGDEFDHKTGKQLDMSRIHQGKRGIIDDPSGEEKKHILKKYDYVVEEVEEETLVGTEDAEYDDEFDDTYESHLTSVLDDARDALLNRRPWVLPAALGGGKGSDDTPEAEVSDDASSQRENEAPNQENKNIHDVRGRGRGRGQSDEVIRNRQFKERHKGRQAHHNRRQLADKKRQRTGFY